MSVAGACVQPLVATPSGTSTAPATLSGTPSVTVTTPSVIVETYDPVTNRVRLVRGTIPAGVEIWVEYLPL